MSKYETCPEIEIAVASYFDPRRNLIVPNVWWGLDLLHECDLFILTKTGYAYEVEIKTSRADVKADLWKRHGHKSKLLRRLYFAMPEKIYLADFCSEFIPVHAGILVIGTAGHVFKKREAKLNMDAIKLSPEKQIKLGHLAAMRLWPLKRHALSRP